MYVAVGSRAVLAARSEEQVAGVYQIAVRIEEQGIPRTSAVVSQIAIDDDLVKLEGVLALTVSAVLLCFEIPLAYNRLSTKGFYRIVFIGTGGKACCEKIANSRAAAARKLFWGIIIVFIMIIISIVLIICLSTLIV